MIRAPPMHRTTSSRLLWSLEVHSARHVTAEALGQAPSCCNVEAKERRTAQVPRYDAWISSHPNRTSWRATSAPGENPSIRVAMSQKSYLD